MHREQGVPSAGVRFQLQGVKEHLGAAEALVVLEAGGALPYHDHNRTAEYIGALQQQQQQVIDA